MVKILLVQNIANEQLGIMSIASVARLRGDKVALTFGRDRRILKAVRSFQPDIVGFNVMTGFQNRWIRIARAIKKSVTPEPLIVFGGPHSTFFPQVILEEPVDVVCRGEGEGAFGDLLEAFESGERSFSGISNLVVKKDDGFEETPMRPLVHLDNLPFPDREISFEHWFIRNDPSVHYAVGRGCPFSCGFCYAAKMRKLCKGLGPFCRLRSVGHVLEEIEQVSRKWGPKKVFFDDDTLCHEHKWFFEFLDAYARRFRFPFTCQMRADQITRDVARALKDAGCYLVGLGVESGVERIRNEVLSKNITDERIREAASFLHNVELSFLTTNMMGLPGERLADAISTLQFNIEIGAEIVWTSLYQPYPGTDMGERALREGFIDGFPEDESVANAHTSSILKQDDIDEIVRLHKFTYLVVKHPSMLPLVLRLVKYDYPRIYLAIHRLTYFLYYFSRERLLKPIRAFVEAVAAWWYYP